MPPLPAVDIARAAGLIRRVGPFADLTAADFEPLPRKGVSNDHFRLRGHGAVLRLPRFSQWSQAARDHFAYQRAAFTQAQASRHTPRLLAALPPGGGLPGGALVVTEIAGRPPRLPADFPALAAALAAIHQLPVPGPPARAPLLTYADPFRDTLSVIETQALALDGFTDPAARRALSEELAWARAFTPPAPIPPPVLTGTDTHPGNFLVDATGKAWFVDLEKAVYGSPAIDLAHATLATSVGWDPDCATTLAPGDVGRFYAAYLDRVGAEAAALLQPWLRPLRRLVWLRTMTWFVRWQTQWSRRPPEEGEAAGQSPDMAAHIARHIRHSLDPDTIAAARAEWL